SAPRWLTEAAYDVFFNDLHRTGLVYPVASATLNAALGGVTGSDHSAFLEKGIPAIDFTSNVDYPIHTPQDHLDNFQPSGLKRTGDLVLALVERFDAGVPSRTTERYLLVQFGTVPILIPYWLLWSFISCSVVVAAMSIVVLRRQAFVVEGTQRVRWSSIKLILFVLIIQTMIWSSESLIGFIKGYRFPWVNNFAGFAILGTLFGLIGLWLVLKWIRRLPLSQHPFGFGLRAVGLLSAMTIVSSLISPELGAFLALALLSLSLALVVRLPVARILFWVLSCLTMLRLVFFEELGLIQRTITENRIHTLAGLLGYEAVIVVLFTILSLPFAFAFAAIYRASGVDFLWLKRFRGNAGLLSVIGLAVLLSAYLLLQSVYEARWFNNIIVEQRTNLGADTSSIRLKGSENLDGTLMRAGSWEETFEGQTNFHEFTRRQSFLKSWAALDRNVVVPIRRGGDTITVLRYVRLHSELRPYTITISYRSSLPFTVESKWAHGGSLRLGSETDRLKIFSWYCFPDTDLVVPISFGLQKGQKVAEEIEVTYDTLSYGLRLQREFTNIRYRTVVAASDSFSTVNLQRVPLQ
ncbi:MAG: Peptidase protein, partial [Bacteroidetes bacterium]|nr:Peptidase protein [Bacteroidota bacterium]